MDFPELLEKRRSVRDYQDKEVPVEIIKEIIHDSVKAANASNKQPWSFVIINDKAWVKKISDASKNTILSGIEKNPDSPMKVYEAKLRDENFNVFYNAPSLVLIVGPHKNPTLRMDVGLLASYLMLSATSRGLGTCWVAQGAEVRDAELLEEIRLPEGHRIIAPIILGYPKEIPAMPERAEPRILRVIP